MALLKRTEVGAIAPLTKGVFILDRNITVGEALQKLHQWNVLSAPVVDIDKNRCLGSVDVLDLLTHVLTKSAPKEIQNRFRSKVDSAIDSSKINPFLLVKVTDKLYNIITEILAMGVHRVPVLNKEGELNTILTQSDVAQFLCDEMDNDLELLLLGEKTLEGLDLVPGNVISITSDCTLAQAFDAIIANDISALAVVNKKGELIGVLSASDCRGLTEAEFLHELNKPIVNFIAAQVPVVCTKETKLINAITQLAANKIHRMFIVDASFTPIGVISLTDVMRIIKKFVH